jgi:hypothetical protein
MNKYWELVADIDGATEIQFGSFINSEVEFEKDAEKESLKGMGFTKIRITSRMTEESPDPEVYGVNEFTNAVIEPYV